MEQGAHGKREINTMEGKKGAMLAEGWDGLSAARDGGHRERWRASLAHPHPPRKPFPGESPEP